MIPTCDTALCLKVCRFPVEHAYSSTGTAGYRTVVTEVCAGKHETFRGFRRRVRNVQSRTFAGHSIEVLITATLDNGYEINVNGVAG